MFKNDGLWKRSTRHHLGKLLQIAKNTISSVPSNAPFGDAALYDASIENAYTVVGLFCDSAHLDRAEEVLWEAFLSVGFALRSLNKTQLFVVVADILKRMRDLDAVSAKKQNEFCPTN